MGKRLTLYVNEDLYRRASEQLPDLNWSQALRAGVLAALERAEADGETEPAG